MGKSLNDTDLATTLVNGLKQLPYAIPAGNNVVIGAREDFETDWGYFALWNSGGEHGIWRTNGTLVQKVIAVVGFTQDMDVSIAIVDGKIYWTDNVNQPRMCNIAKGIANLYPTPYQEWFYTQIKRQPLFPVKILDNFFLLFDASSDYQNAFKVTVPYQFAYYYVFDNDEESRIGPWSDVTWKTDDVIIDLDNQYEITRLRGINVVKQIVFVYRIGNDGIVYELSRIDNDLSIYTFDFRGYVISQTFPSTLFIAKTAVSSDITNARFDSVPLAAATNEVAQNRINLGNFLIDYANWQGRLDFQTLQFQEYATPSVGSHKTFKPNGVYNIGIELLDEWGRTIGVVSQRQITAPDYNKWLYFQGGGAIQSVATQQTTFFDRNGSAWGFGKDVSGVPSNVLRIVYRIQGTLPSWAASYRVVRSEILNVTDFIRTNVRMYYWFINGNTDYNFPEPIPATNAQPGLASRGYIYKGAVIELSSGEPILIGNNEEWYLKIIGQNGISNPSNAVSGGVAGFYNANTPASWNQEYRITKQVNNLLYIESSTYIDGATLRPRMAFYDIMNNIGIQSFFDVEISRRTSSASEVYYQSSENFTASTPLGTLRQMYGDCFLNYYNKINAGTSQNWAPCKALINTIPATFVENTFTVAGSVISKNPIDNLTQTWDSWIGQPNVVNLNQRQTRRPNDFLYSDALIQGTQINGLSKFNSTDVRVTPLENGPITALFTTNARQGSPGVLLAIGNTGVSSFYIGATQLTNVDGSSNVASTTDYAVSQNPLLGQWGAGKLRNICKTPLGTLYWWSEIVNDWIRYSQAGLDRLGQNNSFGNDLRRDLAGNTSVFTTYDRVTDEVMLVGMNTETFVFSEQYKTLQPKRSYLNNEGTPERGLSLSQKTILFQEGGIWVMGPDVIVPDNSFFGELKNPELKLVTNVEPTVLKRWNSQKVYGPKPDITTIETENGLESSIDVGWWIPRKDNYQAAIKMASNTVGGLLDGKPIESRILITNFVFDPTNFSKINYIEILATRSPVQ